MNMKRKECVVGMRDQQKGTHTLPFIQNKKAPKFFSQMVVLLDLLRAQQKT
jgi:hypothetical protein